MGFTNDHNNVLNVSYSDCKQGKLCASVAMILTQSTGHETGQEHTIELFKEELCIVFKFCLVQRFV